MVDLTILGIALHNEHIPVLLLFPHGTKHILQLHIGAAEAYAISTALYSPSVAQNNNAERFENFDTDEGIPDPVLSLMEQTRQMGIKSRTPLSRPMTHDLMMSLITQLDGKLLGVEITRVHDGVYYAELLVKHRHTILRIDCRPSDAIAMAIRANAMVRCHESVLAFAENLEEVLHPLPEAVQQFARRRMKEIPFQVNVNAASTTGKTAPVITIKAIKVERSNPKPAGLVTTSAEEKRRLKTAVNNADVPEGATSEQHMVRPATEESGNSKLLQTLHIAPSAIPSFLLPTETAQSLLTQEDISEETRLNTLLRMLSPETKELM